MPQAFEQLRLQRVPADFTTAHPMLGPLIHRLLSHAPEKRPLCTEVLRALQPQLPRRLASSVQPVHSSVESELSLDEPQLRERRESPLPGQDGSSSGRQ